MNDPCDSEGTLYDERTTVYDCESCEKEFSVSIYTSFSYTTKQKETPE